ncbi:unnamed protein product [Oncorhynchus mykiss]|uniref:Uncharacterized protein n=1 Tax=Oncorhynchus mykiss TaxID=8022 RepID=A0A060ZCH1_ONCMY|nr:unnamed protein product [Oncorhynchus mykiss]
MILPSRRLESVADSVVLMIIVVTTSIGTVFAKDTAFVEVVLFESSPNGDYTTYTTGLQGRFSKAGATISAEGEIVQVCKTQFSCAQLRMPCPICCHSSACFLALL